MIARALAEGIKVRAGIMTAFGCAVEGAKLQRQGELVQWHCEIFGLLSPDR